MSDIRQVRLFRYGRNQAVRTPKVFELNGNEATIRKVGNHLIIEPLNPKPDLKISLDNWDDLDEDWPEVEDPLVKNEAIF